MYVQQAQLVFKRGNEKKHVVLKDKNARGICPSVLRNVTFDGGPPDNLPATLEDTLHIAGVLWCANMNGRAPSALRLRDQVRNMVGSMPLAGRYRCATGLERAHSCF